jgi:uncharacterized protein (DUF1684 family)
MRTLLAPLLVVCAPALAAAPPPAADLTAQTHTWHDGRLERLKSPTGWLTLVGLHWLEEGKSTTGSAPGNTVVLAAAAPAELGTFTRTGKTVSFAPAPKATVTLKGKPFTGGPLASDAAEAPDVLQVGTLSVQVIVRGERVGLRVRDSEAATRKAFTTIERFPVDPSWKVTARFEKAAPGRTLAVPNVLGDVSQEPLAGTLVFTREGKEYRLLATGEDDGLFLVFGDLTNKDVSYGAGRFLDAEAPRDGAVVLDFNRATNPPCAFTPFATCPLPVKENKLQVRVEAGEKRFGKH